MQLKLPPSLFSTESVLQTCDFAPLFIIIVDCEGNPLEMIACTGTTCFDLKSFYSLALLTAFVVKN
jgi:hypothetical protein